MLRTSDMVSVTEERVGIVIPSMNRHRFLRIILSYYAGLKTRHTLYIGDSSSGKDLVETQKLVADLQDVINIVHIHIPGANDHEAVYEVLKLVSEQYVAFSGDDDFLVPSSLDQGVDFLSTHEDYSTVHGVGCMIDFEYDDISPNLKSYGAYLQGNEEHETATGRLRSFMNDYHQTIFSIHRTSDFFRHVRSALEIEWTSFRDLLINLLPVVQGKAKQLDCFYLVRGIHPGQNREGTRCMDWITSPNWSANFDIFQTAMSEELMIQDGILRQNANTEVAQAFANYFTKSIVRDSRACYTNPALERLRKIRDRHPFLKSMWSLGRGLRTRGDDMSLTSLSRSSSPYHYEFSQIYDALTARGI